MTYDDGMARQADYAVESKEMFQQSLFSWVIQGNEMTEELNKFVDFYLNYIEDFSTSERSGGGSFRDHQIARDSLTDEDKLANAYYNSRK